MAFKQLNVMASEYRPIAYSMLVVDNLKITVYSSLVDNR